MRSLKFLTKKIIPVLLLMTAVLSVSGCGKKAIIGELTVINYGEYLDPDMIDKFTKETGIKINYEEAITPEEMYTKYSSGAISYDLVCTADYMMLKMINDGEFQEIPWDQFKYKDNIGQKYYDFCKAFDPDNKYSLPYFWGTIGILYDTTRVNEPVDSWDVLFNGEYSGEIIMQNSMRDTFMITLKYLGYSLNTDNPDELREAQQLLIDQKPDVQAYLVDEARDEVVAGNAIMAVVYSGEAYLGHEFNNDLAYVVPKEGSNIWIDCWGITKNCEHPEYAAQFLDFLCRDDVGMKNFEYIYYSTPNDKVIEKLSKEEREDPSLVPPESSIVNCEVCIQANEETTSLLNDLWKEFKSK